VGVCGWNYARGVYVGGVRVEIGYWLGVIGWGVSLMVFSSGLLVLVGRFHALRMVRLSAICCHASRVKDAAAILNAV